MPDEQYQCEADKKQSDNRQKRARVHGQIRSLHENLGKLAHGGLLHCALCGTIERVAE